MLEDGANGIIVTWHSIGELFNNGTTMGYSTAL